MAIWRSDSWREAPSAAASVAPASSSRRGGLRPKDLMVGNFDPAVNQLNTWLVQFENAARADESMDDTEWPDGVLYTVGCNNLAGSAALWLSNVGTAVPTDERTDSALKEQLRQQFGSAELSEEVIARIMNRRKTPQESFVSFANTPRAIGNGALIHESYFMTAVTRGVDAGAAGVLRMHKPTTLRGAAQAAAHLSGNDGAQDDRIGVFGKPLVTAAGAGKTMVVQSSNDKTRGAAVAAGRTRYGGQQAAPNGGKKKRQEHQRSTACYACSEEGHFARECPLRDTARQSKTSGGCADGRRVPG